MIAPARGFVAASCWPSRPGSSCLRPWSGRSQRLAARPGAEQVVQELADQIWATLNTSGADDSARVDRLMALLETHTDVDLISRLALGRYWNQLPEAQQKDYQQLFRDVVIRSLARRLNGYAPDAKDPIEERFQILGSAPAGKSDTLVRSKVFPRDGPAGGAGLARARGRRGTGDHRRHRRGREPAGVAALRVRGGDRAP